MFPNENSKKRDRANSYHFDELNHKSTASTADVETKPTEAKDVDWAAERKAVAEREAAESVTKAESPVTITNNPSAKISPVKPTVDTFHHDGIHSSAMWGKTQEPASSVIPGKIYSHV